MSRWYLDTSAALKLVVDEAESDALARALDDGQPDLASSWLLATELYRASVRRPSLTPMLITALLDSIDLHEVPPSMFRQAGLLPGPSLRSLDALHLTAAVRIGVDLLITYDHRMADSARAQGLEVLAPT